ncbi:hypothetical protein MTO96_016587 [Rhipicephalus appendiculatus]
MEVARKKSLAAMALALSVEDDEDVQISSFKRKRSCWMKTWMFQKGRGIQNHLYRELLLSDPDEYRRLLRLSCEQFTQLLALVGPTIAREDTAMRRSISPATRLQVTLRYLATDIGAPGSHGDAGIWQTTELQQDIEKKRANLPVCVKVAASPDMHLPPVFVGDDAFPLGENLMKPFGGSSLTDDQKIFNYRLSRARRVAENAFGILSNRFRCLHTVINASPERVVQLVRAVCVLHNFLSNDVPVTGEAASLPPSNVLHRLQASRGRTNAFGASVRERMCEHFKNRGAVPWQHDSAYLNLAK